MKVSPARAVPFLLVLIAGCASSPKTSAPSTLATSSTVPPHLHVGHPMDGMSRAAGTYVLITKNGDNWRIVSMAAAHRASASLRDPKLRTGADGEVLFVSDDLGYVSAEFLVRNTEPSTTRATQGRYTCFVFGFDDDKKTYYPNACNSELTSTVDKAANTAKQAAGAALTLGITAIAANKQKAVDAQKVWAAMESADVLRRVKHFRYGEAFKEARSVEDYQSFISRYRDYDPDALIPQAQAQIDKGLEQRRIAREQQKEQERITREQRLKQERLALQLASEREEQRRQRTIAFRNELKPGDNSHCGLVIEVKRPLVRLQTMIGEYWMRVDQVYAPGDHNCYFENGAYRE